MTSLTTTANTVVEISPNAGMKVLFVEVLQSKLATTTGVNPGDTFTVDLASYGASKLWDIQGSVHTTLNSVISTEAPTVTVAGTILTVTIGGAGTTNSSETRVYQIIAQ